MKTPLRTMLIGTSIAATALTASIAEAGYRLTITDCMTGRIVPGAYIKALAAEDVPGRPSEARTGGDGTTLVFPSPADRQHQFKISATGYQTAVRNFFISSTSVATGTVCLDPMKAAGGSASQAAPPTTSGAAQGPSVADSRPAPATPGASTADPEAYARHGGEPAHGKERTHRGDRFGIPFHFTPSFMARSAGDRAAALATPGETAAVPFGMAPSAGEGTDDAVGRLGGLIAKNAAAAKTAATPTTADPLQSRLDQVETMLDEIVQAVAKLEVKLDRPRSGGTRARPDPSEEIGDTDEARELDKQAKELEDLAKKAAEGGPSHWEEKAKKLRQDRDRAIENSRDQLAKKLGREADAAEKTAKALKERGIPDAPDKKLPADKQKEINEERAKKIGELKDQAKSLRDRAAEIRRS